MTRFVPVTADDWTGIAEDASYLPYGYTEVTDAFDYRFVDTDGTYGAADVAAYKHAARGTGTLIRFRGSFTLTALPSNPLVNRGGRLGIFNIACSDDIGLTWDSWNYAFSVWVRSDGKMALGYGWSSPFPNIVLSDNTVSADTTYDIEFFCDQSGETASNKLYVNGSLWIEAGPEVNFINFTDYTYVAFQEGMFQSYTGAWYGDIVDVTLHVGKNTSGIHMWTIEPELIGSGRWSMMWVP